MIETSNTLQEHIIDKIKYHDKLRKKHEADENYEQCLVHKKEIERLKSLLENEKDKG